MTNILLAAATAGALCVASMPASAQMGRIDPGVGKLDLPVTQVQFRGGHRFRPGGGPGFRHGGGWRGGYGWRHRGGGYGYGIGAGVAGLAAGALIGGAIASQAAPAYGYGYGYDAEPVYAPPPPPGGDATAYCMQRFKSYDPASGTYLGYDGLRHPCP